MAKESNNAMVLRIMRENATKTRDQVIAILVELMPEPPSVREGKQSKDKWCAGYYNWGIKNGAPGAGKTATAKSAKAPKAPKATKTKKVKVPSPRVAGDREKASVDKSLTVEELNDIRAKNMAKLKAVGKKYADGRVAQNIRSGVEHTDAEARAIVAATEAELDTFKAPAFLKMADVKALV